MDKKNTLLGTLLILAAFACYFIGAKTSPPHASPEAVRREAAKQIAAAPAAATEAASAAPTAFVSASGEHQGAVVTELENDYIQVRFTNFGGAIRDVALKKYPAQLNDPQPFVFNGTHSGPMLAFVDFPGLDRSTPFQLVAKSANEVVFRAVFDGRVEVTRRYDLSPDQVGATDPYQLHYETTFRNLTGKEVAALRVSLEVGTAAPLDDLDTGRYLTTGYSTSAGQNFISRSQLEESGGIFGYNAHSAVPQVVSTGPITWATVTNQFFVSILTPSAPPPATDKVTPPVPAATATGIITRRVKVLEKLPDGNRAAYGVTADAQFDVPALAPHGTATLAGDFYVGPKEYRRLANTDVFHDHQDKVMQFGFFKVFSELLLTLMTWIHSFVPNWGLAIICTTLALKTVFLPFTLMAARSAKRMQKLQPQLKLVREKFKDSPQKQQQATMALFKEHKVNPMGGCLPMLLTLPFFWGFFRMLYSAAELRFSPFLWAHDLSAPDTVGHLAGLGIAINIFPVLLGATSFIQMQLTPQPTVDNAQAKMMKFMPLMFMFFCYTYPCALSLYSTTNGLFSILQQLVINKTKDPVTAAALPEGKSPRGKPMKNVTPKRK